MGIYGLLTHYAGDEAAAVFADRYLAPITEEERMREHAAITMVGDALAIHVNVARFFQFFLDELLLHLHLSFHHTLTYDDGPGDRTTEELLDLFEKEGMV